MFAQTDDEIMKELNKESKSNFKIGIGLGNKVFSTHNSSLNAQETEKGIVFTPFVGYYHKSGLSLTATGYILNSKRNSGLPQVAINPAYDYYDDNISSSVSYTHYFVTSNYNTALTPVQNDFFASINSKKGWLQPGFQIGYAAGTYKEITPVDTTVKISGVSTHYQFIDTASIKQNSFSLTGTLQHTFNFRKLISNEDLFSLTPQLLINFGSGKYSVNQTSSGTYSFLVKRKRAKKNFRNTYQQTSNLPFKAESIGFNLEGVYSIGKFEIDPDIYIDYYLPKTNAKKLTTIFTINFSYSF
ncbi:MAG: hypothetical protein NVS3B19_07600 [Ginsengibacter sp.]